MSETRAPRGNSPTLTTRSAESKWRRFVESDIVGIIVSSLDGRLIDSNDEYLRLIGYTRDELASGSVRWDEITPPEYQELEAQRCAEAFAQGKCAPYEKEYIRKDGTRVPVIIAYAMLDYVNKECICYVVDLTAQKKTEAALKRTAEQLEKANRDLELFTSIASHDLREPLRSIRLQLQLLERSLPANLGPEVHEHFSYIINMSAHLHRLVEDLLAYSSITGKSEPTRCELDAIARSVVRSLEPLVRESEATIEIGPLPVVRHEESQLRQLFQNLIANSLKFRAGKSARVRIRSERLPNNDVVLLFEDDGVGIAPEDRDKIFELFRRGKGRDKVGGAGIGLATCKKIVSALGGTISVESEPGRGSTFKIVIPQERLA